MKKVKTKSEVRLKLKEWIEEKDKPFTTGEARLIFDSGISKNLSLSTNRLSKLIRGTSSADFDKKTRTWLPRLKPSTKLKL